MKGKRRNHTAAFKADKTLAELAGEFGVHRHHNRRR